VVAGIGMAAGMRSIYAPFVGAVVAALVLLVAKWWAGRSARP
jgi:hypothetical protein